MARPSAKNSSSRKVTKTVKKKGSDPLYPSAPRNFRLGNDILPTGRDLGRYVKWPRNIRVQRQKKIIMQRLKVPPSVNQFTFSLEKTQAVEVFKLLAKYRPETKKEKSARLSAVAQAKVNGKDSTEKPGPVIKYGLKHVTTLVEQKKAKIVLIACDVVPLELVIWLPALCRKMGVPYCIVKNKARLGALVHQKNATVIALTNVEKEDVPKLEKLSAMCMEQYNDNDATLRKWGGGIMGLRTQAKIAKREAALSVERARKAALQM